MRKAAALRWSAYPDGLSPLLYTLMLRLSVYSSLLSFVSFRGASFRERLLNKVAICQRLPAEKTNSKKRKGDKVEGDSG